MKSGIELTSGQFAPLPGGSPVQDRENYVISGAGNAERGVGTGLPFKGNVSPRSVNILLSGFLSRGINTVSGP